MEIEVYENQWNFPFNDENAPVFCSPLWSRILKESMGYGQITLSFREGGKHLSLTGSVIDLKAFKIFYSNFPYGGFVGDMDLFAGAKPRIEEELGNRKIDRIYVTRNFYCPFPDMEGYARESAYHNILFLDGSGQKAFEKACKEKVNKNVKKALREGVAVREIEGPGEVEPFFEFYKETIRRKKGIQYWNRRFFDMVAEVLSREGRYRLLYAVHQGEPIGGILLVMSRKGVHYFAGASKESHLDLRPNDLLFFHAIRSSIEGGYQYFDFMLTDGNDENLLRFKKKWGSETYPFDKFHKDLSPLKSKVFDRLVRFYTVTGLRNLFPWSARS